MQGVWRCCPENLPQLSILPYSNVVLLTTWRDMDMKRDTVRYMLLVCTNEAEMERASPDSMATRCELGGAP